MATDRENLRFWISLVNVFFYQFHIKIKVWKYINLIDQNCITYFKH